MGPENACGPCKIVVMASLQQRALLALAVPGSVFLGQTDLVGVVNQLRICLQVELLQDAPSMGVHGFRAYRQSLGDVRHSNALDDLLEHLGFAVGKTLIERFLGSTDSTCGQHI